LVDHGAEEEQVDEGPHVERLTGQLGPSDALSAVRWEAHIVARCDVGGLA
jgi:hypothetical protein